MGVLELGEVRSAAVQALQDWCFGLLQPGQSAWARQTATALLVPFAEQICRGDGAATARCVALLRDCLLEDETVQRKRAQHVLAQLAPGSTGMPAASWTAYDRLLGLTDEYSLHLFEENWGKTLETLHASGENPPTQSATRPSTVSFEWMGVVWQRGLHHANQSASKKVALSFFDRAWPLEVLREVPPRWIAEALVPAIGATHMAKGQHARAIAESAGRWAAAWASAQGDEACVYDLALRLLRWVGSQDLPRTAVAAATRVAAAAAQARQRSEVDAAQRSLTADLLAACAAVTQALKGQGTSGFALDTQHALMAVTSALCDLEGSVSEESAAALVEWLAGVPPGLLLPGGALHPVAAAWLSGEAANSALAPSKMRWLQLSRRWPDAGFGAVWSARKTRSDDSFKLSLGVPGEAGSLTACPAVEEALLERLAAACAAHLAEEKMHVLNLVSIFAPSMEPTASLLSELLKEAISDAVSDSAADSAPSKAARWAARAAPLDTRQRTELAAWRALDSLLFKASTEGKLGLVAPHGTFAGATAALAKAPDALLVPLLRCVRVATPGVLANASEDAAEAISAALRAAWKALSRPSRRKVGATAALVSTCLQPCLFDPAAYGSRSDYDRVHGETGPVAWILKQFLEAGRRSCRLATLTAALCLYGFADEAAALNGADDVVTDPEALADLAALLRPLDESLGAAWAGSDVAPRVAALCLLHCWVRAGEGSPACALWDRLLLLAATDADLASSRYQFKGPTHRRKVRLWQALAATAGDLDTVLRILESNNASTVKQYQEVAAVVLLRATQDPLAAVRGSVLQLLGRLRTSKRDDLPSLILIASQCLLLAHADPAVPDAAVVQFAGEVVLAIVPWALSHVHPVRTFSQLALWRLLEAFPQLAQDDAGLRAMLAFFSGNADVLRLKAALGLGNDLQAFDPVEATSPAGVLYKGVALAGRSDELSTFEGAPQPLVDAIAEFLNTERQRLRHDLKSRLEDSVKQEYERTSKRQALQSSAGGAGASRAAPRAASASTADPVQQKITPAGHSDIILEPWAAVAGLGPLREGGDDAFESGTLEPALRSAGRAGGGRDRQQLIVVASLIDKLPNLAGLARTSEVFRLHSLVVADASVAQEAQFQSISVSANLWMPIQEVPEVELPGWLSQMAGQGWTLVGLEQTPDSVSAPHYTWPAKTVLLLGREKEGIPASPSQPAARHRAIAAYEFTRQRLSSKS
ncbi:hypothetical protein QBZ16_002118 [Prototheca wickerhamii]|uniref:tRNA/rRNA methyltransferase SpoU type domain-containing protein n=1 Tax=Prototheca wickerhamii TaxID=3111 RepID=A0AAD9ILE6_PROWI|nr:hypothetical protein QBZ16_002118 [Prototheca wickerhamii]